MTTVDVTIIDQVSSYGAKRDLSTRLADVLKSLDRASEPGEAKRWMVIAQAVRPRAVLEPEPAQRVADLDYAAWHAHLAGTQRWVPTETAR